MSRFWFEKPAVKCFDHENELCVVGNATSATERDAQLAVTVARNGHSLTEFTLLIARHRAAGQCDESSADQ